MRLSNLNFAALRGNRRRALQPTRRSRGGHQPRAGKGRKNRALPLRGSIARCPIRAFARRIVRDAGPNPAAALVAPFGCCLALPVIPDNVPRLVGLRHSTREIAAIAQGLLSVGVLTDADWNGDLLGSINAALTRWTAKDLGVVELKHLDLELFWLDDLSQDETFNLDAESPDGAFVLASRFAPNLCTVGYWFTEFEKVLPGAGQDIYHVLCWAADSGFNAMTPIWAYALMREEAENFDCDEHELNEEMAVTPMLFERSLPDWVIHHDAPDLERLAAAKNLPPDGSYANNRLRSAAGFALDILQWQPLCAGHNRVHEFAEMVSDIGLGIRWQIEHADDPTGQVMDGEMDMRRQTGESSPLNWLIPFEGVQNIPVAVEKLAGALRLALAIDNLLAVVEDERPIAKIENRVRIRV